MMSISLEVSQKFESITTLRNSYSNSECTAEKIWVSTQKRHVHIYVGCKNTLNSQTEKSAYVTIKRWSDI